MLISIIDQDGNALLDANGYALVVEVDPADPAEGSVEYFFSFENEAVGRADPVVGLFLEDPLTPLWAYNLLNGASLSGWWVRVTQPVPLSGFIVHPNLQFAINVVPLKYPTIVKNNTLLGPGEFWIENSDIVFHFTAYGLQTPNGLPLATQPRTARGRKRIALRDLLAWTGHPGAGR